MEKAVRILDGKVAVITGASRGLGRAMAISLGTAGANVVLVARNEAQLKETAALVEAAGGKAQVCAADITREEAVRALEDCVRQTYGAVHILINNAGVNLRKPITDFSLDEWNWVLTTNVTSAFLMTRSCVPLMKGHGYGRILMLTSMMSHISLPERTAYSASKAALLGMVKALALELAPEGITVNGISPGPCLTEINQPILEDKQKTQMFLSNLPVGRFGDPKEVGELALYLCRPEAGFITGTDIVIDGGWTAK
ncbi:MAG: SDR family oxidoreductase [Bryobacterales bacterium]|nr:SDR family oxidoreductase [Bryobacterales bacterium]